MKTFKCRWKSGNKEYTGTWNVADRAILEADIKKMDGQLIEILEESDYNGPPLMSSPSADSHGKPQGGLRVSRLNEDAPNSASKISRQEPYNAPLIDFSHKENTDDPRKLIIFLGFMIVLAVAGGLGFFYHKIKPHFVPISQDSDNSGTQKRDIMYVSGIVHGGRPIAIIGGQMFKEGDIVNNYKIKSIGNDYVEFFDKHGKIMRKGIGK